MADRVYKAGIPALRKALQRLRTEFSDLGGPTDWVRLRVDPVLAHARSLERLLSSPRFSREFARLRRGVVLFHSDLVYLRTNVKGLQQLLESQTRHRRPRAKRPRE